MAVKRVPTRKSATDKATEGPGKRAQINIKVKPEIIEAIDKALESRPLDGGRSEFCLRAVSYFLDHPELLADNPNEITPVDKFSLILEKLEALESKLNIDSNSVDIPVDFTPVDNSVDKSVDIPIDIPVDIPIDNLVDSNLVDIPVDSDPVDKSIDSNHIESVSNGSVALPDNGTDSKESQGSQEPEKAHPPVETATEAIAPSPEGKIAAVTTTAGEADKLSPAELKRITPKGSIAVKDLSEILLWGNDLNKPVTPATIANHLRIASNQGEDYLKAWTAARDPLGRPWSQLPRKRGHYRLINN